MSDNYISVIAMLGINLFAIVYGAGKIFTEVQELKRRMGQVEVQILDLIREVRP
jgi:hypothetical protein